MKKKIIFIVIIIFVLLLLFRSNKTLTGDYFLKIPPTPTLTPTSTPIPIASSSAEIIPILVSPSISSQINSKCHSIDGLPDPICTPGVIDPAVTQSNIQQTICVSGYTKTVRPSVSYTNNLKISQIKDYGFLDTNLSDYEEDHLISLELGGSPTDPKNLWPEPGASPNPKDKVENYLHEQVCNGAITLEEAQKEISGNWKTVYEKLYGSLSISPSTQIVSNQNPSVNSSCSGATAICNDNTCYYNSEHKGACSRHEGVRQFLK